MLNIIDAQWKDHLLSLDHLKQGIGLVGYGQKDPLVEYKKQSFDLFQEMLDRIDTSTIRSLFNLQVVSEEPPEALRQRRLPRRSTALRSPVQTRARLPPARKPARSRPWFAINPKSAATNLAPVAPGRSTRSVTEPRCKLRPGKGESRCACLITPAPSFVSRYSFLCLFCLRDHLPVYRRNNVRAHPTRIRRARLRSTSRAMRPKPSHC